MGCRQPRRSFACTCPTRSAHGSCNPRSSSTACPGTGLFEWVGPRGTITTPYRVRWQGFDDAGHELYDPYSFQPHIDAFDLARFAHGNHVHAHRFLGAHELTVEGVRGIRFAVWAPNAERVSVVGTFNHWDGRHHPMSVRADSGIWELFIPELRTGELYKYEILGRQTRELFLKTDPYGALSSTGRRPRPSPQPRASLPGRTVSGYADAASATGSASRCRSTRFISARGAAARPADS